MNVRMNVRMNNLPKEGHTAVGDGSPREIAKREREKSTKGLYNIQAKNNAERKNNLQSLKFKGKAISFNRQNNIRRYGQFAFHPFNTS